VSNQKHSPASIEKWWGNFEIPENVCCAWKISLLRFYINRSKSEWNFSWHQDEYPSEPAARIDLTGAYKPESEETEQARFIHTAVDAHFDLGLALADRPIVARPETFIFVPPGQQATLYVSSGLWLQPKLNGHVLMDVPVYRPSDTWFGENTREGEMCYFSRTRARTEAIEPVISPHRVVTPITVINRGTKSVKIERIRVPVVNLSLYTNEKNEFVSNSLSMVLNENSKETTMEIIPIGRQSGEFQLISTPRVEADNGLLNQTIAKFLG
jgi:hypothetical protein